MLGGLLGDVSLLPANESPPCGKLFVIGGGLRADNAAMYQRMIEAAGGREHARFALFRCASEAQITAREAGENFVRYGISRDRLTLVNLTPENADRQAFSPEIVEPDWQIDRRLFRRRRSVAHHARLAEAGWHRNSRCWH